MHFLPYSHKCPLKPTQGSFLFQGHVRNVVNIITGCTPCTCVTGSSVLAESLYRVGHRDGKLFEPNDVDIFVKASDDHGFIWNPFCDGDSLVVASFKIEI